MLCSSHGKLYMLVRFNQLFQNILFPLLLILCDGALPLVLFLKHLILNLTDQLIINLNPKFWPSQSHIFDSALQNF